MKTRNLLLALGCTAMLTACTNNDEPAVAPAMRTVTLSVEVAEPADTRVKYSTEDETTYKFAWGHTDKLRVFYNDGENETYADFTIDKNTINGKKADFTGELPDGFGGTVTIAYSFQGFIGSGEKKTKVVGMDEMGVDALASHTVLYAEKVVMTDGKLPNVKLQHAAAYLLLKEGLKVTHVTGDGYFYAIPEYDSNYKNLSFSSEGISEVYTDGVPNVTCIDTDGKLTQDVLVAFYVPAEGKTLSLPFLLYNSDNEVEGTVTQPEHTYMPGVIYEVADNTKWLAYEEVWEDDL